MIDNKIDVLDHGFVRLVDHMGSDLSIVRNARTSHDAEWRTGEDAGADEKLIRYLYSKGHNTPFECVVFTFDVKAPIFVFRQWHRHRTQSYNEQSARYSKLAKEFYIPDANVIGKQATRNKQSRDLVDVLTPEEKEDTRVSMATMELQNTRAYATYGVLLARGVPRELARSVLPVSMYSHMFATVNLHNLFRFLHERLAPEAQYEIRQYAKAMLELIEPIAPVAVAAFLAGEKRA